MPRNPLITLRATVAMREVDFRIASTHQAEAAERTWTRENADAYARAKEWTEHCRDRWDAARAEVIAYHLRVEEAMQS